jgi:hypothetical protein
VRWGSSSFELAPLSATRFQVLAASFNAEVRFEREGLDGPRLVRLLIEDLPPDTLAGIEVASPGADQLAGYVGRYDSAELQVTYEFVLEGRHLTVRHRNAPQEPLKPVVDDMFHVGSGRHREIVPTDFSQAQSNLLPKGGK